MAIENNLSRAGQNNKTGDDRLLFEKMMMTDVLRFFQATCIGKALVTVKTIEHGKSAAFPVVGNATAQYHTVGTELDGTSIASTEREITIDDQLEAHAYIPDIDSAMSHYDQDSAYNESIGRALAKRYDQDLFRMVAKAGLITNSTEATAAGLLAFTEDLYQPVVSFATAGDELDGGKIYAKLAEVVSTWVEKDIVGEVQFVLKPVQYYALLNNPANTGLTWVNDPNVQNGKVPLILGKRVMTSPHVPSADDSANTAIKAKYRADFSNIVGLAFAKEAVGALHLRDMNMRSDYVPTRLADLVVGKMIVGFGILNQSAATVIKKV